MASSGYFNVPITSHNYYQIVWTQTQYVDYSRVNYKLYLVSDEYGAIESYDVYYVYLQYPSGMFHQVQHLIGNSETKFIGEGQSGKLYHDSEGNYTYSFVVGTNLDGIYWSGEKVGRIRHTEYIQLDPIYKQVIISSAPSFNDEGNLTITYTNPAGTSAKTLQACISWESEVANIPYRNVPKDVNGTYTFELTDSERNIIRNASVNTKKLDLNVVMYVNYDNGTEFWSSYRTYCEIVNAEPELNPTVKDVMVASQEIVNNPAVMIVGYNVIEYATNATGKKGATIKSCLITNGTQSKIIDTGYINNAESPTFTFTVTDSRGYTATVTKTMPFISYLQLTCSVVSQTAEFVDETTSRIPFVISGQYFNGEFGNTPNGLSVTYKYKIGVGEYSQYQTATPTIDGNTYTATVYVEAGYEDSVTLEAGVGDVLNYITATATAKTTPVFDWGANDFNFNVPVSITGGLTVDGKTVPTIEKQGTYGQWTYRKWSDGTAECWAKLEIMVALQNGSSAGWYSSGELLATNLTYPFTFTERPVLVACLTPTANTWAFLCPSNTAASTSKTGSFQINSMNSFTQKTYHISYIVRGKWK